MKIIIQQFLSLNHSWSIVGQNTARSLISLGHSVDLFSTNGIEHFPEDLKPNLIGYGDGMKIIAGKIPGNNYDVSLSYTALKNIQYVQHSKMNRFLMWVFEFSGKNSLPAGFAKHYQNCDKILSPSNYGSQIFQDSGIPADKIEVIPHGINLLEINQASPYPLKTKKRIKILINLGQVHRRKNISGSLEIFGKAFSKKDDVCLIIKVQDKKPIQSFELSFTDIYNEFERKFPNHAEVEIIRNFIPNIYSLYKSCDITFAASNCEGFGLPPFEGLSCGLIPIASRHGGFLDFLDDNNSLLIDGNEFNVPPNYLYYNQKSGTKAFMPNIDCGIEKLRLAVSDFDRLSSIAKSNASVFCEKYSWDNAAKQILDLVVL